MSRLLLPIAVLSLLSFTLLAESPRSNPFRGEAAPASPEAEGDRDFKKGDYRKAAQWYAGVAAADAKVLSEEQKNAWAYCRIKLAAEAINSPGNGTSAAAIEKDVAEALEMAASNT